MFPETSTKYLGIILDENLNWAEHLQYVSKKLSIAGGIMYRLQHYLTPKLLKLVYYSIAYPHLQYAITSWGKAPATYINKAQVQQNRLIRILSNTYKQKVKLSFLYSKLNILKIEDIYNLEALKFMCKFKNKTLPTPFRHYFITTQREIPKKEIIIFQKSTKNLLKDQLRYVEPNCGTNSLLDN